jgi:hypothetical protein
MTHRAKMTTQATTQRSRRFIDWIFLVIVGGLIGGCAALLLSYWSADASEKVAVNKTDSTSSQSTSDVESETKSTIIEPNPILTPEQVVQLQLKAIHDCKQDAKKIEDCFAFASPANREVVGSSDNLLRMVRQSYNVLLEDADVQIGQAVIEDRYAVVLVTIIDREQTAYAFRFFLSKQDVAPWIDCWMTDEVRLIDRSAPSKQTPADQSSSIPTNQG